MLEKTIEAKIVKYAKEQGFLSYKFSSPNNRGVPDRIFISPQGRVIFIEFKSPGKKLTKLQYQVRLTLEDNNCDVRLVDNVEYGMLIIQQCK